MFKETHIHISIDDVDERNNYARGGSDFNLIDQNLVKFAEVFGRDIRINCTVNWYNIWDLHEVIDYATSWGFHLDIEFVNSPEELCIINLPENIKTIINDKYKNNSDQYIQKTLSYMNQNGQDRSIDFFNHVRDLDKKRNESFEKVFPEWSKILNKTHLYGV